MDLLYVTEGVPNRDPVHGNGSSMIPFEVIRHLPDDVRIRLLTFADGVEVPQELAARCLDCTVLPLRRRLVAVARSVVSTRSIGAQQRATRLARREVRRLSRLSDVTLLHGPHVSWLTRSVCGPSVLQIVDPWSLRVGMDATLARGWRRAYRRAKGRAALAVERRLPRRTRLLTVGREDAQRWSAQLGRPVRAIPNGADPPTRPAPSRRAGPPTICFVGSLNYEPNIESASILVRDVAPLLWAEEPEARLVIAGRKPDPAVLALAGERVEVLANVPSVGDVFAAADAAVFPDRRGLGIRNSVSEALAAGLPVVASPVAAREQPEHPLLHVAATVPDMVAAVNGLLRGAREVPPPGTPGARTWQTVAQEYYEECVRAVATPAVTSRRG